MWLKGGVCVRVLQEDRSSGEEAVPESVCADLMFIRSISLCHINSLDTCVVALTALYIKASSDIG